MRTNSRITFIQGGGREFNFETGEYEFTPQYRETRPCHLSTLGIDRSFAVFGDYRAEVLVARLLYPYLKPFDSVEINGIPHKCVRDRLNQMVFYVTEDSVIEDE